MLSHSFFKNIIKFEWVYAGFRFYWSSGTMRYRCRSCLVNCLYSAADLVFLFCLFLLHLQGERNNGRHGRNRTTVWMESGRRAGRRFVYVIIIYWTPGSGSLLFVKDLTKFQKKVLNFKIIFKFTTGTSLTTYFWIRIPNSGLLIQGSGFKKNNCESATLVISACDMVPGRFRSCSDWLPFSEDSIFLMFNSNAGDRWWATNWEPG